MHAFDNLSVFDITNSCNYTTHIQVAYREFGLHALSMEVIIGKHTCNDPQFSQEVLYDGDAKVVLHYMYSIHKQYLLRCALQCIVLMVLHQRVSITMLMRVNAVMLHSVHCK
jgi:hypothetical protein